MALIGVLQTLVDGQIITAAQHNSNYSDIKSAFNTSAVLTDVAKTIAVTHIWSAAQTFTGGFSVGAPLTSDLLFTDGLYDIGKLLATRPRDLWTSRDIQAGRHIKLTANASYLLGTTTGGVEVKLLSLTADANNITRFIAGVDVAGFQWTNQAQNIGWMTLSGSGLTVLLGSISLSAAASQIVPGATSLSLRNNVNTFDNLLISDAGNATLRGILGFSAALAKVDVGPLSLDFRKNDDSTSILLLDNTTSNVQVSNGVFSALVGGVRTLLVANASLPAAAAAKDGLIGVDTTNSRLVYYVNGLRYFLAIGTSF